MTLEFWGKAWWDENILKNWISDHWGNTFIDPQIVESDGKTLFAKVNTSQ